MPQLLLCGCSAATPPTAGQPVPDPGIVHVHGLDVGPEDGSLYVATHTGLLRAAPGPEAERVRGYRHDLMGFSIVGPGDFIASGHPDMRDENLQRSGAPPLLGLVASRDQGASWDRCPCWVKPTSTRLSRCTAASMGRTPPAEGS